MLIVLSQRIDTKSDYSDKVFEMYHFPSSYKNRIHEGDTFIYYQGNRNVKEQRYYFGVGTIGKITTIDKENYYASLLNVQRFKSTVPIYLPDGKYVETLGYETVRKSPTPPWQSSVRPLSQEAFDYILSKGKVTFRDSSSIDTKKEQLKRLIRSFFLDNEIKALLDIQEVTSELIEAYHMEKPLPVSALSARKTKNKRTNSESDILKPFLEFCKTTRLTYSYKPVLLLAFFERSDKHGRMTLTAGVRWVKKYYQQRIESGKQAEIKKSIYSKKSVSSREVAENLITNPIKALINSGYFTFDNGKQQLILSPSLWRQIGDEEKKTIEEICYQRLKDYYKE